MVATVGGSTNGVGIDSMLGAEEVGMKAGAAPNDAPRPFPSSGAARAQRETIGEFGVDVSCLCAPLCATSLGEDHGVAESSTIRRA